MNGMPDLPTAFIDRIFRTIKDYDMIQPGSRVLVGFSGGPDSTALARVLMALAPRLDLTLGLAHLNHGLRGQSANKDQAVAQAFATANGLELHLAHVDVRALAKQKKTSLEAAGRTARYAFFSQRCKQREYSCIALGHHRDDHTEQILLNLLRGTGPAGLKGIPPKREGGIIRPLIQVSKSDILAYLEALDQPFAVDDSNTDTAFLRNRVRHRLIPFLEEAFNPDIRTGLDRLSRIMALEDDFLERQAEQAFEAAVSHRVPGEITLAVQALTQSHPALAGRMVRQAIAHVKGDLKRITRRHVTDALDLAGASEPGKHIDLPGQVRAYHLRGAICFKKETLPLRTLGQREKDPDTKDHQP